MAITIGQKKILESYMCDKILLGPRHLRHLAPLLATDLDFQDLFEFAVYAGAFIRIYCTDLSAEEAGDLFVKYMHANFTIMLCSTEEKNRLPSIYEQITTAVKEELYRRKAAAQAQALTIAI